MVLSEESAALIEQQVRGHVGMQGVDERWKTEKLVIERRVLPLAVAHSVYPPISTQIPPKHRLPWRGSICRGQVVAH